MHKIMIHNLKVLLTLPFYPPFFVVFLKVGKLYCSERAEFISERSYQTTTWYFVWCIIPGICRATNRDTMAQSQYAWYYYTITSLYTKGRTFIRIITKSQFHGDFYSIWCSCFDISVYILYVSF